MTGMRCMGWRRWAPWVVATVCLAAAVGGRAAALDYNDVRNLVQNQVPEEVILNMVRSDSRLSVTYAEAEQLRSMGVSENLIAALRPRPAASGAAYSAPPSSVTRVESTITASSVIDPPMPAPIVTGAPAVSSTVVQVTPPTVTQISGPAAVPQVTRIAPTAQGSPISPVPVTTMAPRPPRYAKEGWVAVANRDWVPYYLSVNQKDGRMFLSRNPNGGVLIQSGQNIILNVRKHDYKMYGDSGEHLDVKVREDETTTVSLEPFGVFGNSGLTGVSVSRDKVKSEVLINNYVPAPTVVVQEPSVVVVPAIPPPPPVYYRRPPYYRGGYYFGFGGRW